MNPSEFAKLAARTECDQTRAAARLVGLKFVDTAGMTHEMLRPIRAFHAVIGLMGELGEIAGVLERWIFYGKSGPDLVNIKEELGDAQWYIAEMCNAFDIDLNDVIESNIRKLKTRYPDKYSDSLAAEEGRDRAKEREALETPPVVHFFNERGECVWCEISIDDPLKYQPCRRAPKWDDPDVPPGDRSGS